MIVRYPRALPTSARPMPVLPAVPSTMIPPGAIRPRSSASVTIDSAARSLTDPPGFMNSHFASISHPVASLGPFSLTRGVLPIRASVSGAIMSFAMEPKLAEPDRACQHSFSLAIVCAACSVMMIRKASFAPIAGPDTRVLLLGSLPGEASLRAERYYAHPQNQFWRLAGAVIDHEDLAGLDYEARLAALCAAGVGLWDVV